MASAVATAEMLAATAEAAVRGESVGTCGDSEDTAEARGQLVAESVEYMLALSVQCLARLCTTALRCLSAYAERCRLEADKPSAAEPGAVLEGELWVHGLDWPFVSELERARWKARCLHRAGERLIGILEDAARRLSATALSVGRALLASRPANNTGSLADGGDEVDESATEWRQRGEQQLKAMSTALRLDSSAAVGMVHEAVTLCVPVLYYVALGDC